MGLSVRFGLGILVAFSAAAPQSLFATGIPAAERAALIDLYNSTNGPGWIDSSGWLGPAGSECGWYGVSCSEGIEVGILSLQENGLSGPIPPSLGNLTGLRELALWNNSLTGSIPSSLGNLTDLGYLQLGGNQLTGPIPPELGNLDDLQLLELAANQLSGSIPSSLGNLASLEYLYLGGNQLTGPIPAELGSLTRLSVLQVQDNQLSGPIPAELGSLGSLESLMLFRNQLSGPIPPELGQLSNLLYLWVYGNRLSGSIPAELQNLTSLVDASGNGLDLRWNALHSDNAGLIAFLDSKQIDGDWQSTQTVAPAGVTVDTPTPTGLRVSWTPIAYTTGPGRYQIRFYGGAPAGATASKSASSFVVTGLAQGTEYSFYVETVTDPNPFNTNTVVSEPSAVVSGWTTAGIPVAERAALIDLYNATDGPSWLDDTGWLGPPGTECSWHGVQCGEAPFGTPPPVWALELYANNLSGPIPPSLGNLAELRTLWLDGNALSGSIPGELQNLTDLVELDLRWNVLHSDDAALVSFLNARQIDGDWQSTQTVAPAGVIVDTPTPTSLRVSWTPIAYTADTGRYQIRFSGGALAGATADKSASSFVVTGLSPNTSYAFTIETVTDPHPANSNTLTSGPSAVASGTTAPAPAPPGVVVFPTAGRVTTESGGTATFTVVLDRQPVLPVGIELTSTDPTEGTVPSGPVVFTLLDWNVPRTITVTGVDDAEADGSVPYSIAISFAGGVASDPPDVSLVNLDDELDGDGDGIADAQDNCPLAANGAQDDLDGDGSGNECDVDDDADGVMDEVERSAPNGGDGNLDGLADDLQPQVASLRTSTDKTFLTLSAPDCPRLADVLTTGEVAVGALDGLWDFPYGLVRFRLPSCAGAAVTARYHGIPSATETLYREHRDGGWSTQAGAVFSPGPDALVVALDLPDGVTESLGGPAGPPLAACGTAAVPLAIFGRSPRSRADAGDAQDLPGPKIVATHRATLIDEDEDTYTVEYEVTVRNVGPAPQFDNPGPEILTFLPPCSEVLSVSATSGTIAVAGGQALAWDVALLPESGYGASGAASARGTVKVTKTVPIREIGAPRAAAGAEAPRVTWWQSLILSDAHLTGVNDTVGLSDDPSLAGEADPTSIQVADLTVADIPTASDTALLVLSLLLAGAAMWRLRGAAALGVLLVLLLPASAAAQKKITCPNGEVRHEMDVKDLALKYEGWSLSGTLSSLSVMGTKVGADQKVLQQAAAATQQWNELIKGLALGWNRCVITKQQFAEGLERIYPRLKEDAADLEKIRQLLAQGQQAEEKRLKTLLDSYFANLRRFAEIGGQDVLLDRIAAVVEREVAEGTERLAEGQEKILAELAELKRRLAEAPLAAPEVAKSELARRLEDKSRVAEESYQAGYNLVQRFRFEEAVPHFERALAQVKLHEFYVGLADTLLFLAETGRAEELFREALALAREEGSETHEAEISNRLARVLLGKGDLEAALESARRALEIVEKSPGADPMTLAEAARTLGEVLAAQGDLDGALEAARRALRTAESALGSEHEEVGYYANSLGAILHSRGDLEGALQVTRRALGIFEKTLGEHAATADALGSVGTFLYTLGHHTEALDALKRALEMQEKIFGPDHTRVADLASNLAMIRLRLGDLDEALRQARRALQIDERTLGTDHPQVAIRAGVLAQVLLERGDLDAALRFAERALRIEEAAYGPDHPSVALDLSLAGTILRLKGDLDGARAAAERALRIDEATLGADHHSVARDHHNLAAVLHDQGDLDGALRACRKALNADELAFGSDHPNVARDSDTLASILLAKGDLDGALRFAQRALQIAERVFGPDHPRTGLYARSVGRVLQKRGDQEGAKTHFDRALRILSGTYGPDNPATQRVAEELASLGGQAKRAAR